jgi:hypothetical protein
LVQRLTKRVLCCILVLSQSHKVGQEDE